METISNFCIQCEGKEQCPRNNDIIFVYEDIPADLSEIAEAKAGISDAFELDGNLYGYHIVEVDKSKLTSHENNVLSVNTLTFSGSIATHSVIKFRARMTCNRLTDCHSCLTTELKTFECHWCPAMQACSSGIDRKR